MKLHLRKLIAAQTASKLVTIAWLISMFLIGCQSQTNNEPTEQVEEPAQKMVIYQVFTRLFGNTDTSNKPWGTLAENGVGKFSDFTDKALQEIKDLGATHIWYTGVPHHALIADYSALGISADDPDVVKGRAGSPYAVKDYYNVNPDLATDPAKRLDEFKALVERTHKNGLKVLIDIVPNHVARHYVSLQKPDSVQDFGATDDTTVAYARDNDFYYIPGQSFKVPTPENNYQPLGGEAHPLSDGRFLESPAKWTGNGSRLAQPAFNDWYETVKINYGIRPDGTPDFDTLPASFATKSLQEHYAFWQEKSVPGSWKKFRDIAFFWLNLGVDGFRFDMAEMVPVEFWSYLNASIKNRYPNAKVVAEVYNPAQYRNYIHKGKMDYLYDKVALYDTLKSIIQGRGSTDHLPPIQKDLADIEHHMLHFLENHDEQRIASPEFAGNPEKAKPAMVVSATLSSSPTLIYFGQELGEPGALDAGFGKPSRTSIFDYVGVPHHQRWMNGGKFDGGQLSESEKTLRDFYRRILNLSQKNPAMKGTYADLHLYNRQQNQGYTNKLFSFARWHNNDRLIIFSNFSATTAWQGKIHVPQSLLKQWNLNAGAYSLTDLLYEKYKTQLEISDSSASINVSLQPLESLVLMVKN